jgi:3-dehydroquinate synthase
MADASIGGKTGINLNGLKNLIGTFTQPKAVFVNPDFLKTLPDRHINNGMAEIYKISLVLDKSFWKELNSENQFNKIDEWIYKSIGLKNKIVIKDPLDKADRKILNFGHTVGHAIETCFFGGNKEILHGEAIYSGMIVESHLSWQKKLLLKTELLEIVNSIRPGINLNIKALKFDSIYGNIKNDKKNERKKICFSLLNGIGQCRYNVDVSNAQLVKAIDYYNILIA